MTELFDRYMAMACALLMSILAVGLLGAITFPGVRFARLNDFLYNAIHVLGVLFALWLFIGGSALAAIAFWGQ